MAHPNTPAGEPGTAVVQTEKGASALIQAARHRIEPFLFPGQTVERVMQAVYLATKQEPKILNCTGESIVRAVARVAQWGLEVGTTAHLVPFGDQCTPVADYKGLGELMLAARAIRQAPEAACVYEHETFAMERGLYPRLEHQVIHDPAKRGKLIGAYCVLRPTGAGTVPVFEYLAIEEIDAIRQKHSKQWKQGPCPPWYAKKTVVRQAAKLVPKNPRLATILAETDDEIPEGTFEPAADEPLPRQYQLGAPLAGQASGFEYEGQQELDVREPVRRNTARQVEMPKPGRVQDAFRAEAQAASERYIEHAGQPAPADDDDLAFDRALAADDEAPALPLNDQPRKGRNAVREGR